MDIKDRIASMTADLPALLVEHLVRFGVSSDGHHRLAFEVRSAGERLCEVAIIPGGLPQEQVDSFAGSLHALISGSEGRVADAEERAENLRRALEASKLQISFCKAQLDAFDVGRSGRGDSYAIEGNNGVWLCGRPSADAFGFYFPSWGDLARTFPGLRPAGVKDGHIVMRPIGEMGGAT